MTRSTSSSRAVGRLEAAHALEQNGSTDHADRLARETVQHLETVAGSFAGFADDLERPADSLVRMSRSLRDLAGTKADETREGFALSGAGTPTATPR